MRYKAAESPDCGEVEGVRHEGTEMKKSFSLICTIPHIGFNSRKATLAFTA